MSSIIRRISRHSRRIHRASLGLVILVSLAAFALRVIRPTPVVAADQAVMHLDASAEPVAH
jgi:hypothetical protein